MRKSQNKPFPVRSCYTSRLGVVYDANNFSADLVPDASSSRLDSVWRLESVKERINKLEKTLLGLSGTICKDKTFFLIVEKKSKNANFVVG